MENNPFAPPESDPSPSPSTETPKRKSWQKTVGAVFLLVAIVPALVLIVFYYREVSVTYYMTRNPLAPAATHLAVRMQAIILGNMRALAAVASSIVWTSPPPTESSIRQVVGKYVQEGDLAAFAGIAVMDSRGTLLAMVDRRDISPYLDVARSLSLRLVARGGRFLTTTLVRGGGASRCHTDDRRPKWGRQSRQGRCSCWPPESLRRGGAQPSRSPFSGISRPFLSPRIRRTCPRLI